MSKPNVFIIESLRFADEKKDKFEGRFLSQILNFGEKESDYYYIRTKKELVEVLKLFSKSDYRYLHISCHGTTSSLFTTLDEIPFSEFGQLVRPYLAGKRLFISACSAVNDNLAKQIFSNPRCYSVIGPNEEICFNDAAIIWASFYHLMFRSNPRSMKREHIFKMLRRVVDAFEIPLCYFSVHLASKKGYKRQEVKPKQKILQFPKIISNV